MGINNKPYWQRKEEKKRQAEKHTKEMERFGIGESIVYGVEAKSPKGASGFKEKQNHEWHPPVLLETDTVSGLYEAAKMYPGAKMCVLNFASYKNPGGGFMNGSTAQEECLCHESNLYNTLVKKMDYYEWNRKHLARGLYLNRAVYSKDIVFVHDGEEQRADVLTCAAPNFNAAGTAGVSYSENIQAVRDRIRFVKDVMCTEGVEVAVLGAFGCGVFRQNARDVADIFADEFGEDTGITAVYAVIKGLHDDNLNEFRKVFGQG